MRKQSNRKLFQDKQETLSFVTYVVRHNLSRPENTGCGTQETARHGGELET